MAGPGNPAVGVTSGSQAVRGEGVLSTPGTAQVGTPGTAPEGVHTGSCQVVFPRVSYHSRCSVASPAMPAGALRTRCLCFVCYRGILLHEAGRSCLVVVAGLLAVAGRCYTPHLRPTDNPYIDMHR